MSGYTAFARYYDRLTENVDYPARAAYFHDLVRHHGGRGGGLLLDLACGTGSLSLELSALGYDVIGVDASADMLSVAVHKAGQSPHDVLFLRQGMAALNLFGTVDVTVCALDSLNHLSGVRALGHAFARVELFLNPGGLFLFDVNTAYKHRQVLADNAFVYELDDVLCCWRNAYRGGPGHRVDVLLDFFERRGDGRYVRHTEQFSEVVFSHETLCRALEVAGFRLLATYGDDTRNPPGPTAQRVIYVAEKLKTERKS